MKGMLIREWSIWHSVIYASSHERHFGAKVPCSRQSYEDGRTLATEKMPYENEEYTDEKVSRERGYDEGMPFLGREREYFGKGIDAEAGTPNKTIPTKKRLIFFSTIILYIVMVGVSCLRLFRGSEGGHFFSGVYSPAREVFEVSLPFSHLGVPVHSQSLLAHSFGNSWGQPAVVSYAAPDVSFNKVVLELNTTVKGTQYDRLANLFLGGISLWRTSTPEPARGEVYSTVQKDVSAYLKLFQTQDLDLMFQLDNLLNSRLDGIINVTLTAHYYSVPQKSADISDLHRSSDSFQALFSMNRAADQIYPVVANDGAPPLVTLPSKKMIYSVPKLNANTTRVRLNLFVSGNGAEEFWYGNVLDKYTKLFAGHSSSILPGHGPVRIATVYYNGRRVASVSPQPVIYTGGISPALWNPIVGTGAFDIKALEVDLTPLLPLLWGAEESLLEVRVVNGLAETAPDLPSIGENWIGTGNILTWESDQIVKASGKVAEERAGKSDAISLGFPSSSSLSQIVNANFQNEIEADVRYVLRNGTELDVTVQAFSKARQTNVQSYKRYGDSQSVVSVVSNEHSFIVLNNKAGAKEDVFQTKFTQVFPLVVSIDILSRTDEHVAYNASVVRATAIEFKLNQKPVMSIGSGEAGNSTYFLSHSGNHGFGTTEQKFRFNASAPLPARYYTRKVKAVNGTVVKDKTKDREEYDMPSFQKYAGIMDQISSQTDESLTGGLASQALETQKMLQTLAEGRFLPEAFLDMFSDEWEDAEAAVSENDLSGYPLGGLFLGKIQASLADESQFPYEPLMV